MSGIRSMITSFSLSIQLGSVHMGVVHLVRRSQLFHKKRRMRKHQARSTIATFFVLGPERQAWKTKHRSANRPLKRITENAKKRNTVFFPFIRLAQIFFLKTPKYLILVGL